jgi:hypothetical protein
VTEILHNWATPGTVEDKQGCLRVTDVLNAVYVLKKLSL